MIRAVQRESILVGLLWFMESEGSIHNIYESVICIIDYRKAKRALSHRNKTNVFFGDPLVCYTKMEGNSCLEFTYILYDLWHAYVISICGYKYAWIDGRSIQYYTFTKLF